MTKTPLPRGELGEAKIVLLWMGWP